MAFEFYASKAVKKHCKRMRFNVTIIKIVKQYFGMGE